jgi:hypothetical protein
MCPATMSGTSGRYCTLTGAVACRACHGECLFQPWLQRSFTVPRLLACAISHYHPSRCFHMECQWLVATGYAIQDLFDRVRQRAVRALARGPFQ